MKETHTLTCKGDDVYVTHVIIITERYTFLLLLTCLFGPYHESAQPKHASTNTQVLLFCSTFENTTLKFDVLNLIFRY